MPYSRCGMLICNAMSTPSSRSCWSPRESWLLKSSWNRLEEHGSLIGEAKVTWNYLQMKDFWQSYDVELVNYQNKTRLIKGWDELFNKLKEHQNSLAAMKLSPYYKQFEEVGWLRLPFLLRITEFCYRMPCHGKRSWIASALCSMCGSTCSDDGSTWRACSPDLPTSPLCFR